MANEDDKLKRIVSAICAALFVVATMLGIPVSESLLNVGQPQQKKGSRLSVSDACEAEIQDIPVYGDLSKQCKEELERLDRRVHRIESLCKMNDE